MMTMKPRPKSENPLEAFLRAFDQAHASVLLDCVNELRTKAEEAALDFSVADDPSAQRVAVRKALRAIFAFGRQTDIPCSPLTILYDAILQLDSGSVLPLLTPDKKPGRAPTTLLLGALQGHTIGTVRALTECGVSLTDARTMVAAELNKAGLSLKRGEGRITARTITGWQAAARRNPKLMMSVFAKRVPSCGQVLDADRQSAKATLLKAVRRLATRHVRQTRTKDT